MYLGTKIRMSFFMVITLTMLFGCNKYKKTTPVQFSIHTSTEIDSKDYLQCEGGIFRLTGMELRGKREKGADVSFYRDLSENMIFGEYYSNESIDFDLPQGSYTDLTITLDFHGTDGARIIKGKYESSQGPIVPFLVELEDEITISAKNVDLSEIWNKEEPRITFEFGGINWFDDVPKGHFQSAYVHDIVQQGQDAIYIKSTMNQNIYQKVLENIAKSRSLTIE